MVPKDVRTWPKKTPRPLLSGRPSQSSGRAFASWKGDARPHERQTKTDDDGRTLADMGRHAGQRQQDNGRQNSEPVERRRRTPCGLREPQRRATPGRSRKERARIPLARRPRVRRRRRFSAFRIAGCAPEQTSPETDNRDPASAFPCPARQLGRRRRPIKPPPLEDMGRCQSMPHKKRVLANSDERRGNKRLIRQDDAQLQSTRYASQSGKGAAKRNT